MKLNIKYQRSDTLSQTRAYGYIIIKSKSKNVFSDGY